MQNNTVENWQKFSERTEVDELIKGVNNLPEFQVNLAEIIDSYYAPWKRVLEVWSEFWLTSFLLNDGYEKYLLDFDSIALEKSKALFRHFSKKAEFVHQDMFEMKFQTKFDIIFNAGVLEHFSSAEREILLLKYSEYLADGWILIIAVPNHYNFLYRTAYLLLKILKKWSFPDENKIFDLKEEISKTWLLLVKRVCIDKENIFRIWWRLGPLLRLFFLRFMKDWYLTVLIIKKWK